VLDASAILAVLLQERGHEVLTPAILAHALASTVNLSEVAARLVRSGGDPEDAWLDSLSSVREVVAFDQSQARTAARLVPQTQSLGLSFGDRACLALALTVKVPVYTADKNWKKLNLGLTIHLIR
jgi:ribonuclease VapC